MIKPNQLLTVFSEQNMKNLCKQLQLAVKHAKLGMTQLSERSEVSQKLPGQAKQAIAVGRTGPGMRRSKQPI